MNIKASKKDVIWNYVGIIMTMTSNLLLLPFMMKYVPGDYLGLWYIYLSIGGIVALFDFGLNPTFARNVAYCWSGAKELNPEGVSFVKEGDPNYILLSKVIDVCRRIYLIISSAALFVLLTVGFAYVFYVSKDIFDLTVVSSWLIYSLAVFLNLYYGYFATFLRGVGAVSVHNKINVFARTLQIIISIVLMIAGFGIIAVALAYLLFGFLLRFFSKRAFFNYRSIGEKIKNVSTKSTKTERKILFSTIWHNAWRDGVISLAAYLSGQASVLIGSFFLSLEDTGIYSISVQLVTAIAAISGAMYSAYQPSMQSAYVNNNKRESERLMAVAMTVYLEFFLMALFGLVSIGIPLLKIAKPSATFDVFAILGIGAYYLLYRRQTYYASFISNTNHVPYVKAYIISGICGVLLSVIFVVFFNMGIWGLIAGQFVPQLVYNCWKWPNEVYKLLDSSYARMFKIGNEQIFKALYCRIRGNVA